MDTVEARYSQIRDRIAHAASAGGRNVDEIVLVGASKRQSLDRLQAAFDAGLRVFGENRVNEALEKQPHLQGQAEWHLIGPLQANKAARAASAFTTIHSIDRAKIARRLDRCAAELGKSLSGLLEVNLGLEDTKHGFLPGMVLDAAQPLLDLEHLKIVGLMAIPPHESNPAWSRTWFRQLRTLRDELFSRPGWSERPGFLSMGMSDDFEIAIEEGATHVRIGTALFGPRS